MAALLFFCALVPANRKKREIFIQKDLRWRRNGVILQMKTMVLTNDVTQADAARTTTPGRAPILGLNQRKKTGGSIPSNQGGNKYGIYLYQRVGDRKSDH